MSQIAYFFSKYYIDNSFAQTIIDAGLLAYNSYNHDFANKVEKMLWEQSRKGAHNFNEAERIKFRKNPNEGIWGAKKFRQGIKPYMENIRQGIDNNVKKLGKGGAAVAATLEVYDLNRGSTAKDILRSAVKLGIIGGLMAIPGLGLAAGIISGAALTTAVDIFFENIVDPYLNTTDWGNKTVEEFLRDWTNGASNDFLNFWDQTVGKFFNENFDIEGFFDRLGKDLNEYLDEYKRHHFDEECLGMTPHKNLPRSNKAYGHDPLILNLDGKGIRTLSPSSISARFDHNADGIATATGWAAAGNGLLVLDRNQNGKIDDGTELFGNHTLLPNGKTAVHGYEALAALDENHDGVLNFLDGGFGNLKVWQDFNQDGIAQDNELALLNALGIQSLNLAYQETNQNNGGNRITHLGSYTKTDGTTGEMGDVVFAENALYNQTRKAKFVVM